MYFIYAKRRAEKRGVLGLLNFKLAFLDRRVAEGAAFFLANMLIHCLDNFVIPEYGGAGISNSKLLVCITFRTS